MLLKLKRRRQSNTRLAFCSQIADRQPPHDWEVEGSLDLRERGRRIAREVLAGHFPEYVDAEHDRWIRERYEILLPREAMQPA